LRLQITDFQKRLCNELQNCIPITKRPFQKIADKLNKSEKQILLQIKQLQKKAIIRRMGPVINYRALGQQSTLAAAHIEKRKIPAVVKAVNALDGVSHNYLREHYYNLWFTLRADSQSQIKQILDKLSKRFKTDFHSLPAITQFKLDVRFDAESNGRKLLRSPLQKIAEKRVRLSDVETRVLLALQQNFKLTSQPFDYLCTGELTIEKVLDTIKGLLRKGVLRRIAAVIDYRKIGFSANVLFACKVAKSRVKKIGEALAKLPIVSHCYSRKGFTGFDYNLFAMIHSDSLDRIDRIVKDFMSKNNIEHYGILPTIKELKKSSAQESIQHKICIG